MNAISTRYLKVGVVVALGLIFVGVVANSLRTMRGSSAAAPPLPAPSTAVSSPSAGELVKPTAKVEATKPVWPEFALAEVIEYDPFAIAKPIDLAGALTGGGIAGPDGKQAGGASSDEASAGKKEAEAGITGRIHAVYERGGKTAALIGSKTVRPGDQLEGAGRVVEVDQSGLMLQLNK